MNRIGIMVLSTMLMFGCSTVKPDAGEEAVLIMKPFIFGNGGVHPTPIKTGLEWVAFTTDYVIVDMKPRQLKEHFDDLMSSDGVPLDFDAYIRLRVTDSVTLVTKFGANWYENNVQSEFRNRVRQSVRKYGLNETAISTSAIEAIDEEVSTGKITPDGTKTNYVSEDNGGMVGYLKSSGLPIELIDVTIGRANPPDSVMNQRTETAAQQQRAITEAQRKLAEDARMDAEKSRAMADNAYRNEMKMTIDMFIQLEQIKMLNSVCGKSEGRCTFLVGSQSGTVSPVVNVNK